jgi:hypothetical protein
LNRNSQNRSHRANLARHNGNKARHLQIAYFLPENLSSVKWKVFSIFCTANRI